MSDKYWVALRHAGDVLGGGMVIQRGGVVLTARHCLRGLTTGDHVDATFANGRTVRCRIDEVDDWDIALVVALDPGACDIAPPQTDISRPKDSWFAPYRPSAADPSLTGTVISEHHEYRLYDGTPVPALQLQVQQILGDYSGYSGGPVERDSSDENRLIGILLEQYLDRELPERATNVLFAATIREALLRFRRYETDHLFPRQSRARTAPCRPAQDVVDANTVADLRLRALRQWQHENLVSAQLVVMLELRIAEDWIGSDLGGSDEPRRR
jgi:hypothetical protein